MVYKTYNSFPEIMDGFEHIGRRMLRKQQAFYVKLRRNENG